MTDQSTAPTNNPENTQIKDEQASTSERIVLKLPLKDESALHASFMPFIKDGGLFVPTDNGNYRFGNEVIVAMHLLSTDKKLAVPGKVVWISPKTGDSGTPGVGIRFTGNTKAKVKLVLQTMLGNRANIPALNRVY
jgi:type IV pilus assembly protein PilZ